MREVKRGNPSVVTNLQYDKLYVNHRCFVWSDVQGRVVPYTPVTRLAVFSDDNNVSHFRRRKAPGPGTGPCLPPGPSHR